MSTLDNKQKDLLISGKQYLIRNDLIGFYKHLNKGISFSYEDSWAISKFLEDSGVHIEDYLNELPSWYRYAPDRWIQGSTLIVPSDIKKLNYCSLMGIQGVDTLYILGVEEIGDSAFAFSEFTTVIVGPNLKKVHRTAFEDSEVVIVNASKVPDESPVLTELAVACGYESIDIKRI